MDRDELHFQAQALISRAYRLPETERDAFLEDEAAADPQLRAEVRWLLDALSAPDDEFLESSPLRALDDTLDHLKAPAPRDFRLLQPLGEGGMGRVFLAERAEGDIRQRVALKLLNLQALANPLAVGRFLNERQLLAQLNHPNVARLIDAGALADGRPFLAMEYVEGLELDRYCREHRPPLAARLQLFLKICAAVRYAHQHLIIHRDLKPANILVTADGEPKLLDFGIARAASAPQAELTGTVASQRFMTLAYASPEQLAGQPLSTATDIYSLGVVLYEMLAGARPWADHTDPLALARQIDQSDPKPPGTVLRRAGSAGRRFRWQPSARLPADLDAIVLKAMRKAPRDRYESVAALIEDLENFLRDRPVRARQGQAWYRARKFMHRNRLPLAAAAAAVLLLTGFGIDRQRQLELTRREKEKAQQVRDFLADLFTRARPEFTQGQAITAKELVDRGAERMRRALPADPASRALLLGTLATTYAELGEGRQALGAAEEALAAAREAGPDQRDLLRDTLLVASSAATRWQDGQLAERHAREALAITEASGHAGPLAGAEPGGGKLPLGRAKHLLAFALHQQGRPPEVFEPWFRQAVDAYAGLPEDHPERINLYLHYGRALANRQHAARSVALLDQAWKGAQLRYGQDHPASLQAASVLGLALFYDSQQARAEQVLRPTLAKLEALLGPNHATVAATRANWGAVLLSQWKWEEAEPFFRTALATARQSQHPGSTSLWNSVLNYAGVLTLLGRHDEALPLLDEAAALVGGTYPPDQQPRWQAEVGVRRLRVLAEQRRFAEAELALQALQQLGPAAAAPEIRAGLLIEQGNLALARGQAAAAETAFREALALQPKSPRFILRLAEFLIATRRAGEARPLLQPLADRLERAMSEDSPLRRKVDALLRQAGD